MASKVFHLTGKKSEFLCPIFPPLRVTPDTVIGLTHFQVYNSIPNVDRNNNLFRYFDGKVKIWKDINIEEGTYELSDLENYLKLLIGEKSISIKPNINTLKVEFKCDYKVDFTQTNSIGSLFGMPKKIYEANASVTSETPVMISKVNTIQIEVNIVDGSFINGQPSNCIYKCFINTPPGFRIVETPINVIYLPVNTDEIDIIHVKLLDEQGELINFREETISLELHLKNYD